MQYSDQTKQKLQLKSERNYLGQNVPFGGTQMKFPQLFAVTHYHDFLAPLAQEPLA